MEEDDLDIYEYEVIEVRDFVEQYDSDGLSFENQVDDIEKFDWRK